MTNTISCERGTIGVRAMPDGLDGGNCHLRHNTPAVVRVNLDGIWVSLCQDHRNALSLMLTDPSPAPEGAK